MNGGLNWGVFFFNTKFGGDEKTLHWTSTLNSGTFREIAFALIGCFWPTLAVCDLARVPSSVGFSFQFFPLISTLLMFFFLKNVFKKGFPFPFRHWKKKKSHWPAAEEGKSKGPCVKPFWQLLRQIAPIDNQRPRKRSSKAPQKLNTTFFSLLKSHLSLTGKNESEGGGGTKRKWWKKYNTAI